MVEIKGAHLFSVGTWNDLTFTEADLDQIVQSFKDLKLSGRVPLKFGHNDEQPMTDGKPAIGWVSRVWREGKKLFGDFSNVPTKVAEAIKNHLYKFVSIELLRDAERDGVTYPSVLDAVALLGADPPAVRDLESLSALAWSRKETGLRFSARLAFTQGNPSFNNSGESKPMDKEEIQRAIAEALAPIQAQATELQQKFSASEDKVAKLTAENAALKKSEEDRAKADRQAKIDANKERFTAMTERAVKAGEITPAERNTLREKFMKDDETVLAIDFAIVEMLTGKAETDQRSRKVEAFSRSNEDMNSDADEAAESAKVKLDEHVAGMITRGDKRDKFTLYTEALRLHPHLAQAVHSTYLAGDRE